MQLAKEKAIPEKTTKYTVKIHRDGRVLTMEFNDKRKMEGWIQFHKERYPDWKFEVILV